MLTHIACVFYNHVQGYVQISTIKVKRNLLYIHFFISEKKKMLIEKILVK